MSARDPSGDCPRTGLEQDVSAGKSSATISPQLLNDRSSCDCEIRRAGYPDLMPELAGRVADAFEARIRAHEESALSPLAVRSYETRGRLREEDECGIRTPFQRDRDRIVHSKPFRRLKGKTQVFIDPAGDHYRTRITHTLETTGIARVVARALAAERGSDRGDRARPRHGPSAVRPRRRGAARSPACASASAPASTTTSSRCGSPSS